MAPPSHSQNRGCIKMQHLGQHHLGLVALRTRPVDRQEVRHGGTVLVTSTRVSHPTVTAAISRPQGWALDEKQKEKRRQQNQDGKGQGHVEVAVLEGTRKPPKEPPELL